MLFKLQPKICALSSLNFTGLKVRLTLLVTLLKFWSAKSSKRALIYGGIFVQAEVLRALGDI